MQYGNVKLKYKVESLSIVFAKAQEIRHYPGTDKSDSVNKGRKATKINCTLLAESEEELITIQSILHGSEEKELHFNNLFFKRVTAGQQSKPQPKTADEKIWNIEATFAALDPVPYSSETGEVLY